MRSIKTGAGVNRQEGRKEGRREGGKDGEDALKKKQ